MTDTKVSLSFYKTFFREIPSISGIISCYVLQEVLKKFQDHAVAKIGQPHTHMQTDCYNPSSTHSAQLTVLTSVKKNQRVQGYHTHVQHQEMKCLIQRKKDLQERKPW